MDEHNRIVELVIELVRATEEGRLAWRPTARIDEFSTTFMDRFSILVRKDLDGTFYLRMLDEDGRELLQISDEHEAFNRPIVAPSHSGVTVTVEPPAKLVSRLFDLARRGGLKVNKAIDEVLQGLKRA